MKICYRCKIKKPKNLFFCQKSSKDGFNSTCKDCYSNKIPAKTRILHLTNSDGIKICRTCREEKQESSFSKELSKKDGLKSECKVCDKKRRAKKSKSSGKKQMFTREDIDIICKNKNVEFLDKVYISGTHKYNFKCKQCDNITNTTIYVISQREVGCMFCSGKKQRSDIVDIKNSYNQKNITFCDSEYLGSSHHHNLQCNICEFRWSALFIRDVYKNGCPKCTGNLKHSLDFVISEYKKRNIIFCGDTYKSANSKNPLQCEVCGHKWNGKFTTFLNQGCGCFKCGKIKAKATNLIKYGFENQFQNEDIKTQIKATNMSRYGTEYPQQNKEIALRSAKNSKNTEVIPHWKTNEELVCTASYEIKVVKYLNENKINFLWQPEVFRMSTGKTYRPDMYLIDEDKWVEIKGYFRGNALAKWTEFITMKENAELWDKNKLKEMKIL